jgi:hypothetical protein
MPICSQLINALLKTCKENELDFDLKYSYYDEENQITNNNTINCSYHWDIIIDNDHGLYPQEISVYDKGFDGEVKIFVEDILSILPQETKSNEEEKEEHLCKVMDNLYNMFCNFWDNKDYDRAKAVMQCLRDIAITRCN